MSFVVDKVRSYFSPKIPQWKIEALQYRDGVKALVLKAKNVRELDPAIVTELSNELIALKTYLREFREIDIPLLQEFGCLEDELNDELLNQSFYKTSDRVATGVQIAKELVPSCVRSFVQDAANEFADRLPKLSACIGFIPKMSGIVGYQCAWVGHKWAEQLGGIAHKFASKEYPSPKGILRIASDAAMVYTITKWWSDPYDPLAYVVGPIAAVTRYHLGMSPAWDEVEEVPVPKPVYGEKEWEEDVKKEAEAPVAISVPPAGSNPFDDLPPADEW